MPMIFSPLDIVEVPGYPGVYARRVIVDAWVAAGRPTINGRDGAGRTYDRQQYLYDLSFNGGSPADNPANTGQPRAHMRFVAMDLSNFDARRLEAAGLVRPFSYEPWHWTVANVYAYPIVFGSLRPADITPYEEDFMASIDEFLNHPAYDHGPTVSEHFLNTARDIQALKEAVFFGGEDMDDKGRSIDASLGALVKVADRIDAATAKALEVLARVEAAAATPAPKG